MTMPSEAAQQGFRYSWYLADINQCDWLANVKATMNVYPPVQVDSVKPKIESQMNTQLQPALELQCAAHSVIRQIQTSRLLLQMNDFHFDQPYVDLARSYKLLEQFVKEIKEWYKGAKQFQPIRELVDYKLMLLDPKKPMECFIADSKEMENVTGESIEDIKRFTDLERYKHHMFDPE